MDKKILVLILTAFLCGSIRNNTNTHEEFQGRLAKEINNQRRTFNSKPHYLKNYDHIGHNLDGGTDNNLKGKTIHCIRITSNLNQGEIFHTQYVFRHSSQ